MDPFVALSTTLDPRGGGHQQPMISLYANYVRALSKVGLNPILITPAHDHEDVRAIVKSCAGLVLSGGEDVEPSRYGQEPIPELGEVSPGRDAMEWCAVDAALDARLPIFGICRGMQLLNVYFGGTLYQDLAVEHSADLDHYQEAPWGEHQHEVHCAEGSWLHRVLRECEPIRINSYHHQAVKDLAPSMRCTAEAEDGLIEGIESTEHDWIVGVQWHPERHEAEADHTDPNLMVLQAFAAQVRDFAAARR